MKIYVVLNVARQVEGDLVVVKTEQGFSDRWMAEEYLNMRNRMAVETVRTDAGDMDCLSVRGIYEVDVLGSKSPDSSVISPRYTRAEVEKIMEVEKLLNRDRR